MNKFICFLVALCICSILNLYGQGVAINTTKNSPDNSAMLDISSTTLGILIPRMTSVQRNSIITPANGLMVFDTDTQSFWFYDTNEGNWIVTINNGNNYILSDLDKDTYITLEENTDDDTARIFIAGTEKVRFSTKSIEVVNTGNSVYIGEGAGKNDDLNNRRNVAIGTAALGNSNNRTGLVAIGDSALYNNGTNTGVYFHATQNTGVGSEALFSNSNGYRNTAIGFNSLYSNTSGMRNYAGGSYSLYSNVAGNNNTAIGNDALYSIDSANRNTATGSQALYSTTKGSTNTANGFKALYENTTGYSNVAIGTHALYNSTIRSNQVAIGDSALYNNGLGANPDYEAIDNMAVGSKALYSSTTGNYNVAVGSQALYQNIGGSSNTAHGYNALNENSSGNYNTAIGYVCMSSNIDGDRNFGGGIFSLHANTAGSYNTALGNTSLASNTEGNYNVGIGSASLPFNKTGSYNTAIGYLSGPASGHTDLENSGAFGNDAKNSASNQIRIGNSSVTSIGGYVGWTNLSDGRFKDNIKENVAGLDFILKLRPVTYNIDVAKVGDFLGITDSVRSDAALKEAARQKEAVIQTGFIAQEVEEAALSLGYYFSGVDEPKNDKDFYGLRYAEFVVPLVKAVQEQQEMIRLLQKQNAMLLKRIEKLE